MSAMLRRIRDLTAHAGGDMQVSEVGISHRTPQVPQPPDVEAEAEADRDLLFLLEFP